MANPERGEVALTVGDRMYTLVLDMDAQCQVEALMSRHDGDIVTMGHVFVAAAKGSLRHLRALVWGALRRNHGEITEAQAGDLIVAAGGAVEFLKKLAELRNVTEPERDGRPRKARQSGKAGGRTTSTRGASG